MDNFEITSDFTKYKEVFLRENSKLNLISKNDEKVLFEKHIYDSLAIKLFFNKYGITGGNILDIGCGGGFPSIPLAIEFPNFHITAIDSIRKKIKAVEEIKTELNLKNLSMICGRVENLSGIKFDIITSRAVAELDKICEYALPLLKKDGYFAAYKSKKAVDEIKRAEKVMNNYRAKIKDIIPYTLPLEEKYERNLIIISF